MKILVVEDNPLNLKLFYDTLAMRGYEVITARNGSEALEILKTNIPDLIILDLYMPGMSGFRLANMISKDHIFSSIPIIVVSASSSVYDVKEMATYNVKAYLVKPVSPTKLLDTVKKVILAKEEDSIKEDHHLKSKVPEAKSSEDNEELSASHGNKENQKKILETGIKVSVEDLIEGMVLGAPVIRDKVIIYKEGTKVDEVVIKKIKALGIKEVYITEKSFSEFKDLLEIKSIEDTNDIFGES
ncbi:MAG: response regulator [Brevinematia bacterium]